MGVRKWYDQIREKSYASAEVELRRLSRFCDLNHVTPTLLAWQSKKKSEAMLGDTVTVLEKRGSSPGYVLGIVKATKSWLDHNGKGIDRTIRVPNAGVPALLGKEGIPLQRDIEEILGECDSRGKVAVSLLAYSGLRIESLGNTEGSDGLVLGDLPDLNLSDLAFRSALARVIVRSPLSKEHHDYFSYLNGRGCRYLTNYLKERKADGEELVPRSPVIRATGRKAASKLVPEAKKETPFVSAATVSDMIRRAIQKSSSYRGKPTALRLYFGAQTLAAENSGQILRSFRTFFMGRKGELERRYAHGRNTFPPDLMEQMAKDYARASECFVLSPAEVEMKESIKALEDKSNMSVKELETRIAEAQKETIIALVQGLGYPRSMYVFFRGIVKDRDGSTPVHAELAKTVVDAFAGHYRQQAASRREKRATR